MLLEQPGQREQLAPARAWGREPVLGWLARALLERVSLPVGAIRGSEQVRSGSRRGRPAVERGRLRGLVPVRVGNRALKTRLAPVSVAGLQGQPASVRELRGQRALELTEQPALELMGQSVPVWGRESRERSVGALAQGAESRSMAESELPRGERVWSKARTRSRAFAVMERAMMKRTAKVVPCRKRCGSFDRREWVLQKESRRLRHLERLRRWRQRATSRLRAGRFGFAFV